MGQFHAASWAYFLLMSGICLFVSRMPDLEEQMTAWLVIDVKTRALRSHFINLRRYTFWFMGVHVIAPGRYITFGGLRNFWRRSTDKKQIKPL